MLKSSKNYIRNEVFHFEAIRLSVAKDIIVKTCLKRCRADKNTGFC